jgi:hypothetical protein
VTGRERGRGGPPGPWGPRGGLWPPCGSPVGGPLSPRGSGGWAPGDAGPRPRVRGPPLPSPPPLPSLLSLGPGGPLGPQGLGLPKDSAHSAPNTGGGRGGAGIASLITNILIRLSEILMPCTTNDSGGSVQIEDLYALWFQKCG